MRQQIPMMLVLVFGVFMIFQYFVPHETSEWIYEYLLDWIIVIGVFALAPGLWSLYRVSVDRIKNRRPNWLYSYVTLIGLLIMIIFGFTARTGESWGMFIPFILLIAVGFLFFIISMAVQSRKVLYLALSGVLLAIGVIIAATDNTWGFYFRTPQGLTSHMFVHFFDHILIPIFASMFALLAFFIASAAYRAFRARNLLATLLLLAALIVMSRFNPYLEPIFGEYMSRLSNWLMNVPNLAAQRAIVIGVGLGIVATALKVILGIERGYMGRG